MKLDAKSDAKDYFQFWLVMVGAQLIGGLIVTGIARVLAAHGLIGVAP